jgi:hypothetical protein
MTSDRPQEKAFESSEVKGLWFVTARRYALHHYGDAGLAKVVAKMKPRHREVLEAPLASAWYEEEAMQASFAAAREVFAPSDDEMLELFEGCTRYGITYFWRIALRITSTEFAVRALPTTWRHIRRGPGQMAVQVDGHRSDGHRAAVNYTRFPYFDDVNYRLLVLGTLRPLLQISTGKPARVTIAGHGKSWLTAEIDFD